VIILNKLSLFFYGKTRKYSSITYRTKLMLLNLFNKRHINKLSDSELLNEIAFNQNKLAIGELYHRYAHLIFGVALKYLKNKSDAEDVVMLIFENVEKKIKTSHTNTKLIKHLKNWLYTITKHECLMALRKKNIQTSPIEYTLLTKADTSIENLESFRIKDFKLELLEAAIEKLKPNQKICIEAFYINNKSYDIIAKETGFELKKVKSYVQNGKRNLKILLENEEIFKT
jgi:RNA polymerase sigma-70 factor (ECF subfamily)